MNAIIIFSILVCVMWVSAKVQVSQQEFQNALTWSGFPAPSRSNYGGFLSSLRVGNIKTKLEAAMFLTQILHESGGLRYKEELLCTVQGNPCTVYQSGDWTPGCNRPGKRYFGRGYIQLSYCSNYRAASRALGLGDRLADQPELVSQNQPGSGRQMSNRHCSEVPQSLASLLLPSTDKLKNAVVTEGILTNLGNVFNIIETFIAHFVFPVLQMRVDVIIDCAFFVPLLYTSIRAQEIKLLYQDLSCWFVRGTAMYKKETV